MASKRPNRFRNLSSVCELHIKTADQKPMTELDLALPGSLVIEAAGIC